MIVAKGVYDMGKNAIKSAATALTPRNTSPDASAVNVVPVVQATAVQTEQIVCSQLEQFFEKNSDKIINNVSNALIAKITDQKLLEPHLKNFFTILNTQITDKYTQLNKDINAQIIISLKTAIDKQIAKSLSEQLGSPAGGSKNRKFRKAKTIKKLQKKIKTIRKSKKQYSQ